MVVDNVRYGYARVSRSDDQRRNLESQVDGLVERGIRPDLIYRDVESGGSFDRPGWSALRKVVRRGDTVCVLRLDRFGRNMAEGIRLLVELEEAGIGIVSFNESLDTRDGSPIGRLMVNFMLSIAQWYLDTTKERIKEGQARARDRGRPPGRREALSSLQKRFVFEQHLAGVSKSQLAREMEVSRPTIDKAITQVRKGFGVVGVDVTPGGYSDVGCDVSPSCLECPLARCQYEEEEVSRLLGV